MQSRLHATKLAKKSALPFRSQFGFVNLFQRAWFKWLRRIPAACDALGQHHSQEFARAHLRGHAPRGLHDQIRDVRNFLATERTRSCNVLQKFYRCCFLDIADRSMARCALNACQSEPGCPQATRELQRRGGHLRRRACGLGARAGLDLEMLRGCVAILRYACARAGACRDNNVQTH